MKVRFLKTSFTVAEVVKIDGVAQQPTVKCTLMCKTSFNDAEDNHIIINSIYGSDVLSRISDRLTQAGYNEAFIASVIVGKEFQISAETQVHPGDVYDEAIGKHIAETKARIKVFKIMSVISEELERYSRMANETIHKLNDKNQYLFTREQDHLMDVLGTVISEKQNAKGNSAK